MVDEGKELGEGLGVQAFEYGTVADHIKKYKVTCIETWGDRVLVGGSDGSLRIFEDPERTGVTFNQVRVDENLFNRRQVDQLQVITVDYRNDRDGQYYQQQVLLSLADGIMRLHDMPSYAAPAAPMPLRSILEKARGAYLFAMNVGGLGGYRAPDDGKSRAGVPVVASASGSAGLNLAVAVRGKKIIAMKWDSSRGEFALVTELMVPDTVRTIDWAGSSLCLGFKKEYNMIHVASGAMTDIFGVGRRGQPVSTLLPEREIMLAQDNLGLAVTHEGKRTRRVELNFADVPNALAYHHPYVLACVERGIEVRNVHTGTLVQSIGIRGARFVTKNGNLLYVASGSGVRVLMPVKLQQQVGVLVARAQYKEALSLVANSDDTEWDSSDARDKRLNHLHVLYSYSLFNSGQYALSMQYFQRTNLNPRQIIALFPEVVPSDQANRKIKHPVPHTRIPGAQLNTALQALIPYLQQLRGRLILNLSSLSPTSASPSTGSGFAPSSSSSLASGSNTVGGIPAPSSSLSGRTGGNTAGSPNSDEDQRMSSAASRSLNRTASSNTPVMAGSVPRRPGAMGGLAAPDDEGVPDFNEQFRDGAGGGDMQLLELIDTVLLKSYLLTDTSLVLPFLQQKNFCQVEEAQVLLRSHERHLELICFFRSRALHSNALELLANFGSQSAHGHAPSHTSHGSSSNSAANQLFGTSETVKYLQELAMHGSDVAAAQLIYQYSTWVFQMEPEEGLRIFTHSHNSRPPCTDPLPPSRVLDHLKRVADADICIAYLESLINIAGETAPTFHNELVFFYLDMVLRLMADPRSGGAGDEKKLPNLRGGAVAGQPTGSPSSATASSSSTGSRVVAGTEPGRLGVVRRKLLDFLRRSQHYAPEKMLSKFPRDDLLEERAVLLSRIHQHTQALTIYAHKLRDPAMAEAYCAANYNQHGGDEEKDMYLHLLRVYLRPPADLDPPVPPQVKPALALLSKHFDRIDATQALPLLPADTPVVKLMPFLTAILTRNRHTRRNNQIVKNLLKAEHLHVRGECLRAGRTRIFIDNNTTCSEPSCRKKIGNSAFVRLSDGRILHYVCSVGRSSGTAAPSSAITSSLAL